MTLGLSNTELINKALRFYLEHHEDNSVVNGCKQGVNKKNFDIKYKMLIKMIDEHLDDNIN